jgi:hypothetical protein
MTRVLMLIGSFVLVCAATGSAQSSRAASPQPLPTLPREREIEVALSAAPEHLRAGAAVYARTATGYVLARKGTNGFTCIIQHTHPPRDLEPNCYDAEGTAAILPRVLYTAERRAQGADSETIEQEVEDRYRSGRFRKVTRPAFSYMLSPEQRFYDAKTGSLDPWHPHVMIFFPELTNADIGGAPREDAVRHGLPFVAAGGTRDAMIVIPVRYP